MVYPTSPQLAFLCAEKHWFDSFCSFFGIGVCLYNMDYLTSAVQTKPVTVSHRGVSTQNGAQNTLEALEKQAETIILIM